MEPYKLRPSKASDNDFIYGSWLESFRHGPISLSIELKGPEGLHKRALLESEIYYRNYRKVIDRVLSASRVDVLCNPEDEDHVFGFIVHRNLAHNVNAVSFIYIKQPFRRMGLSDILLKEIKDSNLVATHAKQNVVKFIKKHGMIYNPFLDLQLGAS